jgi:hypothetical protein
MSNYNSRSAKPYSFADNFIDQLSVEDRCCLELVQKHYEKAELEGDPDRPVTFTQRQIDARVAEMKREKKAQVKNHLRL